LNPGRRGGKLATNRLSYGAACPEITTERFPDIVGVQIFAVKLTRSVLWTDILCNSSFYQLFFYSSHFFHDSYIRPFPLEPQFPNGPLWARPPFAIFFAIFYQRCLFVFPEDRNHEISLKRCAISQKQVGMSSCTLN
jgi:hypothetical protein